MNTFQSIQHRIHTFNAAFIAMVLMLLSPSTLAAGGLDEAIHWVDEIISWAYAFLGSASLLFCIYLVIMALIEKKQWADVFVGMGKVAVAGGILIGADYAWSIWGS